MTYRARATLFLVGIVLLPLAFGVLFVQLSGRSQATQRTDSRLEGATAVANAALRQRLDRVREALDDAAAAQAFRLADSPEGLERLRRLVSLDYLVVVRGTEVTAAVGPHKFLPGVRITPRVLASRTAGAGLAAEYRVRIVGEPDSSVLGGVFRDRAFLEALGVAAATVSRGDIVATTGHVPPDARVVPSGPFDIGGDLRAICLCSGRARPSGVLVAVSRVPARGLADISARYLVLFAIGIALAVAGAFYLAHVLSRPVDRLAREVIATSGPLPITLRTASGDDVDRAAQAMEQVRTRLGRRLERLGGTLGATLDLDQLLPAVLDEVVGVLDARSGAVYLRSGAGAEMTARARAGEVLAPATLAMGEGVAGAAAGRAVPVLFPSTPGIHPSRHEPPVTTALAVPLLGKGAPIGAVALYGRRSGGVFRPDDLTMLAALGEQVAVAVQNVYTHEEASRLSVTDALTGAWNRRYLELTLNEETERGHRFGHPYSVLMIDIDQFKQINDRYGHERGDAVLAELTKRVSSSIRASLDTLARFGGEEFVIVLPETDRNGAVTAADKIRRVVRGRPFGPGEEAIAVTVSIGVASYPQDGETPEDLIRAADRALYEAKRSGRDRVVAHAR